MPETIDIEALPRARIEPPRKRLSVVWIIPLVAAVVAIGIAIQRIRTQGPTITILFQAASGVQAGKTFVRYKDVEIGQVTGVELAEQFSKVKVTVQVQRSAAGLMVEDTRFWVVEPRVTLSGITGLGTLLSGNYIGIQPGQSPRERHHFIGLDTPPAITDQPGRSFILKAPDPGSLGVGAPVYFRRFKVGEIAALSLRTDGTGVDITAFVYAPYDKYVTPESRFWDASGIDVSLTAEGLAVRTQSLVSVLAGGVAFDEPSFESTSGPAEENAVFTLFRDEASATKQPDPIARRYVIYTDSLQGIQVGAPVKLLGVTAGEVADVGLAVDTKTGAFRPRLLVTLYPERIIAWMTPEQEALGRALASASEAERTAMVRHQIEDLGLRAQLRTGNLLTGERYVALDYDPKAKKPDIDWSKDPLELPVSPGGLSDLESKANGILDQVHDILATVDRMPLEPIAKDLGSALKSIDQLLKNADANTLPELAKTMADLRSALAVAQRVLKNTDQTLLGKDAPAQQDLRDALLEITRAARAVRVLADYLERNPEALIRGKGRTGQ